MLSELEKSSPHFLNTSLKADKELKPALFKIEKYKEDMHSIKKKHLMNTT
jgi:hypothetical protein